MNDKSVLFICNTPFQLFNALRIMETNFKGFSTDIILSNHSKVNMFYRSCKNSKRFRSVYCVKSLKLSREFYFYSDKKKEKALRRPKKFLNKIIRLDFTKYSYIFTANVDGFVNLIYRDIIIKDSSTRISCYEDGWVTYTMNLTNFGYSPFEKIFHEDLGEKIFQKDIEEIWVYDPRLLCFPNAYKKIRKIPQIREDERKFKNLVNEIFRFSAMEDLDYENIFLEEAFLEDGHHNNDFEIIKKISNIVGTDHFVVKRHPRLNTERYKGTNIKTNKNLQIPWEVYILNSDFKQKILFTITSNACMTPGLVFGSPCRVVYLKNALQGAVSRTYKTNEFQQFIGKYIEYYGENKFYQPQSFDQIEVTIDQMLYDEQKI